MHDHRHRVRQPCNLSTNINSHFSNFSDTTIIATNNSHCSGNWLTIIVLPSVHASHLLYVVPYVRVHGGWERVEHQPISSYLSDFRFHAVILHGNPS